ncbi:CBN-MECR-1 protein [Aphelenchoides avenae]|nr:CBN-MECR-1 protein [Aphelenchus avenae]
MALPVKRLVYREHGDAMNVLKLEQSTVDPGAMSPTQVVVKWLAATMNPFDFAHISGSYLYKPPLPAVGGNEGVGVVEAVGTSVKDLCRGDRVVPSDEGIGGTWCTRGIYDRQSLYRVDAELPLLSAATMFVNPPTAYRMLKDFVPLDPGDSVLQNGANSALGRYIIQMCRIWGYKTVNIVRNRPNFDQVKVKMELKDLGADEAYTEEEFNKFASQLKGIRLTIDCAAGDISLPMASALDKGGVLIEHSGMSGKPAMIPVRDLIFKDIQVRGFWLTQFYRDEKNTEMSDNNEEN